MIRAIANGNLSHLMTATSVAVSGGNQTLGLSYGTPIPSKPKTIFHAIESLDPMERTQKTFLGGKLRVMCRPNTSTQLRFSHTDLKVPNFDEYRRTSVKNPELHISKNESKRKNFTYIILATFIIPSAYASKALIYDFVSSLSATQDVLALAKIEVKLGDIPIGKTASVKWRGKPLFIKHRSEEDIAREREVPMSELRDPQTDEQRCPNPEWMVVVGVCTHLGCIPMPDAGEYKGGSYCACHASHFDGSGRIRKGPAPTNLEVPPYHFEDENTLVIG